MAFSDVVMTPAVLEYGGARINDDTYVGGAADFAQGDLVRMTDAGTLVAWTDADVNAPAVSKEFFDVSEEGSSALKPILIIAQDTVMSGQLNSGTGPAVGDVGDDRDLEVSSQTAPVTDIWGVDTTSSNSAVTIIGRWVDDHPYDSGSDLAGAYGLLYFQWIAGRITGLRAA
jgi:hypothetical protein